MKTILKMKLKEFVLSAQNRAVEIVDTQARMFFYVMNMKTLKLTRVLQKFMERLMKSRFNLLNNAWKKKDFIHSYFPKNLPHFTLVELIMH